MKPLSLSELKSVLSSQSGPCVSLYISGDQHGLWAPKSVAKYKRMLKSAEKCLTENHDVKKASSLLAPLKFYSSLEAQMPDAQSLCYFSSPEVSGFFPLKKKVNDLCVVADSFHVSPIADFVNPLRTWYLVKLTKSGLNLYQGRGQALEFVDSFSMPNHPRLKASTANPVEGQRYVRFSEADHYFIDSFIGQYITDENSRFPLILSGTKTDTDGFAKSTTHNFDVTVNFSERYKEMNEEALLKAVLPKVNHIFDLEKKMALAGLSHAVRNGRTTCDLRQVVNRLNSGELRTLAVTKDFHQWGSIDWNTGSITMSKGSLDGHSDCIYDDLMERAMVQGCRVLVCAPSEMPNGVPVLAV